MDVQGTTTIVNTVIMNATNAIQFEGATSDSHETTLQIINPTEDQNIFLPNSSGYLPVLNKESTTAITATPEEINRLQGINPGTATSGKALVVNDDKKYCWYITY